MNLGQRLATAPLRFYRKRISKWKPPCCRYHPTCSSYAIQAIERFGVIRGMGLATWRIARCNPLAGHGDDPVPEKKS